MKGKVILLGILVAAFLPGFAQQVPNGSFENWSNVFTPQGWTGDEDLVDILIPLDTSIFTFEDTTTFTEGTASLKLVTDTINGQYSSAIGTQTGIVSLGWGALDQNYNPQFAGIPFTYRPDSFIFDYKLTSPGTDTSVVNLLLSKQAVPLVNIGYLLTMDSSWTHVALPLGSSYTGNEYPDTLLIQFISSGVQNQVIGTTLHIDGVRFGYVNPALSVTVSGATTFCSGDSVTLQANTDSSTGYTYQWKVGGTAISGATGSSYVAKATGMYTVTIDSASASATSQSIAVTDTNCTTGIVNLSAISLSVYPNPVNGMLNVNSDENLAGFGFSVYDMLGRVVVSQTLESNNNKINFSSMADGNYIYRITDMRGESVAHDKITVVK